LHANILAIYLAVARQHPGSHPKNPIATPWQPPLQLQCNTLAATLEIPKKHPGNHPRNSIATPFQQHFQLHRITLAAPRNPIETPWQSP